MFLFLVLAEVGRGGAYTAAQTYTAVFEGSLIFVLLCILFFQKQPFRFIFAFHVNCLPSR